MKSTSHEQQSMTQNLILLESMYGDETVFINDLYIKIYKYYFPLATSKTIFFSQISEILYHDPSLNDTPKSKWGASLNNLHNWFPWDGNRKNKHGYFQIILKEDTCIRPCFTPTDIYRTCAVIWLNQTKEGKQYKNKVIEHNQKIITKTSLQKTYLSKQGQTHNSQKQNQLTFTSSASQQLSSNASEIQQKPMILKDLSQNILLSSNQNIAQQYEKPSQHCKKNQKPKKNKKKPQINYQNYFAEYDQENKQNVKSQNSIDYEFQND